MAAAAFQPVRQERASRPYVRHDVDLPGQVPVVLGRLGSAAGADAGVRAEQVDRAEMGPGRVDERLRAGRGGRVARHGEAADLARHRIARSGVQVVDHDARAERRESPGHCRADSVTAARDDHAGIVQLHGDKPPSTRTTYEQNRHCE